LPYDVATAKAFGQIRAQLEEAGNILPDADVQIAATAIYHNLELVSGNLRHFSRISKLELNSILVNARSGEF
jgi:predicted nucleic acid-binding protein